MLKAGDSIFMLNKVPYAWTQTAEKEKMTVFFQPAGKMEEFFVALAALKREPTPAEIAQLFTAHKMQIIGPPLRLTDQIITSSKRWSFDKKIWGLGSKSVQRGCWRSNLRSNL